MNSTSDQSLTSRDPFEGSGITRCQRARGHRVARLHRVIMSLNTITVGSTRGSGTSPIVSVHGRVYGLCPVVVVDSGQEMLAVRGIDEVCTQQDHNITNREAVGSEERDDLRGGTVLVQLRDVSTILDAMEGRRLWWLALPKSCEQPLRRRCSPQLSSSRSRNVAGGPDIGCVYCTESQHHSGAK